MKAQRLFFLVLAALILGMAISLFYSVNRPLSANDQVLNFEIIEGQGPATIAKRLKEVGLISTDRPFLIYVVISGLRNKFYPGLYQLHSSQSIRQIIAVLTEGKEDRTAITFLEGWRINDIATEVAKKTKVTKQEFLSAAPIAQYEGYLFPDTYYFSDDTTANDIVSTMKANFDRRTADLHPTKEQLTIASIVEREAKTDEDRAMVAGVYYNRLKNGIGLEADPTVQYAKGDWDPITLVDYRSIISPYNTYLNRGLPPTPISNPGLAAIKAAVNPAKHDYIYFFHDGTGKTYFSKTLEEHNLNKQKYLR